MYDAFSRITKYFQSYILQINRKIVSCNICKILDILKKNIPMGLVSDIQRYVIFLLFILVLIFLLVLDYMIIFITWVTMQLVTDVLLSLFT